MMPRRLLLISLIFAGLAIFRIPATYAGADAKAADSHAIEQGRHLFNANCAHCHGEDAGAEDPYYNLPQLLSDKSDKDFTTAVTNGIPDKGMPPWKTILKPGQIGDLLVYLRSVEKEQGIDTGSQP
ncbi:MAG: c-type cytochrome [Candidatus Binataceae bacterium]|nr:c-type cytochrome [Candidatus Binataceae bacterium]